jgi:hypothetical protein
MRGSGVVVAARRRQLPVQLPQQQPLPKPGNDELPRTDILRVRRRTGARSTTRPLSKTLERERELSDRRARDTLLSSTENQRLLL